MILLKNDLLPVDKRSLINLIFSVFFVLLARERQGKIEVVMHPDKRLQGKLAASCAVENDAMFSAN